MVRRPLVWCGLPDPLEPAADLREEDHEFVSMRDLWRVWWETWKAQPVTAAEIIERARALVPKFGDGFERENPALFEAVAGIIGDHPKAGARELGYRLRAWRGRILGQYRLIRHRKTDSGISYIIEYKE